MMSSEIPESALMQEVINVVENDVSDAAFCSLIHFSLFYFFKAYFPCDKISNFR